MPLLCWVLWVLTWHCATSLSGRHMLACAVVSFTGRGCLQPASQRRQARGPLRPAGTRFAGCPPQVPTRIGGRGDLPACRGLPGPLHRAGGEWPRDPWSQSAACEQAAGPLSQHRQARGALASGTVIRTVTIIGNLNAPQSRWGRGQRRGVQSHPSKRARDYPTATARKKARLSN